MAANAEIFFEHGPWGRALAWSVGLHMAFAAFIVLYAVIIPRPAAKLGRRGRRRGHGSQLGEHRSIAGESAPTQNVWPMNRRA